MTTVRERAEYLVRLMPSIQKGFSEHVPTLKSKADSNPVNSNLTIGQMIILGILKHYGAEAMSALAKRSQVALSTMTENIDRLAKMDLVARIHDEQDRRVVRIQLTPKGQKVFKQQQRLSQQTFEKVLESLSETQQRRLVQAFRTIETILIKK